MVKNTAQAIQWLYIPGKRVWGKQILIINYEYMRDVGYGNLFQSMLWSKGLPPNPADIDVSDEFPYEVPHPEHTDPQSNPFEFQSFNNNPQGYTELLMSGLALSEEPRRSSARPSTSTRPSTSARPSTSEEPSTSEDPSTLPPRQRRQPNWDTPPFWRRRR